MPLVRTGNPASYPYYGNYMFTGPAALPVPASRGTAGEEGGDLA